ncbi:MAG: class I SAM-dependent methyltransferase [Thermoflexales bacterium]|nr:class I SAM-dependent methyltransferase [Thermoflexales bacterium]
MFVQDDPKLSLLAAAVEARAALFDDQHQAAFRLFNGFLEGWEELAIDLYGRTLVLHNYADPPQAAHELVQLVQGYLFERLPWARALVLKARQAETLQARRGTVVAAPCGDGGLDRRVRDPQGSVWYALDFLISRDAGLYLDTRHLRAWAQAHLAGQTVLNTFAYTGSLGVAARAGGASRVLHLDRNRAFLNVAKTSYTLNGLPIDKADFRAGDFWVEAAHLRRAGERFDCVFLDPPLFSATGKGRVDMVAHSRQLINKVRPLVRDGGRLVAVNNALFVSGADYMRTLEALCAEGYLSFEEIVPVPPDFTGYPRTRLGSLPVDPTPFNHATKIAVLRSK